MTTMMPTALHEHMAVGESQTLEFKASLGEPPVRTIEGGLKRLKDSQHIEFRGAPKTAGYYPLDFGAGKLNNCRE